MFVIIVFAAEKNMLNIRLIFRAYDSIHNLYPLNVTFFLLQLNTLTADD